MIGTNSKTRVGGLLGRAGRGRGQYFSDSNDIHDIVQRKQKGI